jgi:hypothetical protein
MMTSTHPELSRNAKVLHAWVAAAVMAGCVVADVGNCRCARRLQEPCDLSRRSRPRERYAG